MRLPQFSLLCALLVVLLSSCKPLTEVEVKNDKNAVTIHAIEFYSRSPVHTVDIGLTISGTSSEIDRQAVSSDGTATFENLQPGTQYTATIYRRMFGVSEMQSTHTFTFNREQQHLFFETYFSNQQSGLAVPLVMQNPALPNGCEITSLAAILQYYGENISHEKLAKDYLMKAPVTLENGQRIGPDPNVSFAGDPASLSGYYVYAQPIVKAANHYLQAVESERQALDITGATLEQLSTYVLKGIPVLAWITIDLQPARTNQTWFIPATNRTHDIYSNLHAVVVMQMSDTEVTVMNPLKGYETIPIKQFQSAFETLNNRAVVVF